MIGFAKTGLPCGSDGFTSKSHSPLKRSQSSILCLRHIFLAKLPVDRMSWFNLQINIVRALEIICCSSPAWVPRVFAIRRKEVVSGHARCFPAELQITTLNIGRPYWRTITTSAGSTVTWIDSSWCQLDLYRLSLTHYDGLRGWVKTSLTFAFFLPY